MLRPGAWNARDDEVVLYQPTQPNTGARLCLPWKNSLRAGGEAERGVVSLSLS